MEGRQVNGGGREGVEAQLAPMRWLPVRVEVAGKRGGRRYNGWRWAMVVAWVH